MEHHQLPVPSRGCESCHGPGSRHVQARGSRKQILRVGVKLEPEQSLPNSGDHIVGYRGLSPEQSRQSSQYCLSCHNRQTHFNWAGGQHDMQGVSCVDCHNPMKATPHLLRQQEPELCYACHPERRAQANYPSHHPIEEGQILCSDCHNQHGSNTQAMLRADTTNELCYQCHAEKEGPFTFEHSPVSESCANCHEPHGTVANNLLRETEPFLCLGCHTGHQGAIAPLNDVVETGPKAATFYTKCTQCHSTIHGTDLPSTSGHGRFTR